MTHGAKFLINIDEVRCSWGRDGGGVATLGFTSKYTLSGNNLEVEVLETYRELKYPLAEFETFKKGDKDYGKLEDKHLAFAHAVAEAL